MEDRRKRETNALSLPLQSSESKAVLFLAPSFLLYPYSYALRLPVSTAAPGSSNYTAEIFTAELKEGNNFHLVTFISMW